MEKAKFNWSTFIARRRLNIPAWLEKNKIESYKELLEKCAEMGIEPPSKSSVSIHFKKPAPVIKKVEKSVTVVAVTPEEVPVEASVEESVELKVTKKRGRKKKIED